VLNRIAPPDAGTGGSLKPRIVAGIASNALYNAIVAFENKHFPRQRSGFVDPGGPMYQKLVALASAPALVASPPPLTSTDDRMLKMGEKAILRPLISRHVSV
jgi:hypothetical protein